MGSCKFVVASKRMVIAPFTIGGLEVRGDLSCPAIQSEESSWIELLRCLGSLVVALADKDGLVKVECSCLDSIRFLRSKTPRIQSRYAP